MKRRLKFGLLSLLLVGLTATNVNANTNDYTYNITVSQPTVDVVITNTRPADQMNFAYEIDRTNPVLTLDSYTFENNSTVPIDLQAKITVTGAVVAQRSSEVNNSTKVAVGSYKNGVAEYYLPTNGHNLNFGTFQPNEKASRDIKLTFHKDFANSSLTIQANFVAKPK